MLGVGHASENDRGSRELSMCWLSFYMIAMKRTLILLTEGRSDPMRAKTAVNLLRYKTDEIVAVFDSTRGGSTAQAVFGVGGGIPVIGSFDEVEPASTLMIGIAPSGGKLPPEMRTVILTAIKRKMNIVSGLHEFLSADPEISGLAVEHGISVIDLRKNDEREVSHRKGFDEKCLRIQTVGNDCNVGKMVVSLELALALRKRGVDSKFVATGQTGIMIEGDGCPIDTVVVDFVNGAAERLVLRNQKHDILLIEGQGSLAHPRYSAVTLGLLHGCAPDGLILCYEMGREVVSGMEDVRLLPLTVLKQFYEDAGSIMHPCKVIGVAVNGRRYSDAEVLKECDRIAAELGLPACDVLRHGPEILMNRVLLFKDEIGK